MPKNYKYLPAITGIFVTCLLISNIIAVKLGAFGSFFLPVAVIIFPISYIFGDVLTEVYGYARARQVIWIGFACNLLAVLAIWLGGIITPAPFWNANIYGSPAEAQKAYDAILGFTPRLLTASFIAYLVGEFLNAFVIAKLKIATSGKHLWLRTITSTLVGQLADSESLFSWRSSAFCPTMHSFNSSSHNGCSNHFMKQPQLRSPTSSSTSSNAPRMKTTMIERQTLIQ